MIDTMFWPFSIKDFADRMNSLHMDLNGETSESKMYGLQLDEIPIKSFHTLFFQTTFYTIAYRAL